MQQIRDIIDNYQDSLRNILSLLNESQLEQAEAMMLQNPGLQVLREMGREPVGHVSPYDLGVEHFERRHLRHWVEYYFDTPEWKFHDDGELDTSKLGTVDAVCEAIDGHPGSDWDDGSTPDEQWETWRDVVLAVV